MILEAGEEGVLQHLTHLEELILTNKKSGLDMALSFLGELYKTFKGETKSKVFTTIKFDGAPAIITGFNPENNKFFVSTKSLGNINPKVNYTDQDIDMNHGHAPGLVKKLKLALRYLPEVIKQGMYQGDFMFDRDELKSVNVDGEDLIAFKPNTITYAVEANSELGSKIKNAIIGVIFHTRYSGPNLANLKKSSDVNIAEFGSSPNVFIDDAKFKDVSGQATFTSEEAIKFRTAIDSIKSSGESIKWEEIPESIYPFLNTFINSLIRDGRFVGDPHTDYEAFATWITTKLNKEVEKLKTPMGQEKKKKALNDFLHHLNQVRHNVINIMDLTKKLDDAKRMIIDKYNAAIQTKQFIAQPDGSLKVTAPEGYVAVDHLGNMVKLVSRLEFSKANFSVSKGEKFK